MAEITEVSGWKTLSIPRLAKAGGVRLTTKPDATDAKRMRCFGRRVAP
jgi:hypothetical protein